MPDELTTPGEKKGKPSTSSSLDLQGQFLKRQKKTS
jgi:hypothetical protein